MFDAGDNIQTPVQGGKTQSSQKILHECSVGVKAAPVADLGCNSPAVIHGPTLLKSASLPSQWHIPDSSKQSIQFTPTYPPTSVLTPTSNESNPDSTSTPAFLNPEEEAIL